jgi:hypothetical protein
MKNFNLISFFLIFFLIYSTDSFSQSLSASGQNAVNKLQNEHFPRLKKSKTNLETNRSSVSSKDCDNYIDDVNKAVGVWNTVPKADYSNSKIKPIKSELDTYIAFAKEAQIIFKERQAAEQSNKPATNVASNKKPAVTINFKVGDKVSVVSSSEWSWGTVTGIAGKEFQPKAGIANQDIEIDVQIAVRYLPLGKQIVGNNQVFEYWPYHEFFAEIKKLGLKQFFNMVYEVVGKNTAPGYGVFTANGDNLVQLEKEIKSIETLLNKFPAIPADAQRYADRSARDVNVLAFKMCLEGKDQFMKKQMDKRIQEHFRLLNEGDFSPVSIIDGKQLKYVDGGQKTIFWKDIICGSPESVKKSVINDLNNFLKSMNLTANGDTYLSSWNDIIAAKKSKFLGEAEKEMNWATNYPFADGNAMTLYKRDLGGNPIKISFKTSAPKVSGGIQDRDKRKYGVAFFGKESGCSYHQYIEFYILETHKGNGVYDAARCIFGGSGYTKKF